jgi:hypothetical protein
MIVGIVLSVPATPAPPSEPGGVITASENLLGSVGGDLKTRRSSNRVPCLAACPALDHRARRSRGHRGQRDRLTRHPGHRHGHIPPAQARDQPGSARHPVAGLKELNDLLDGPWVRLVYHFRVHTEKSRRGRGWR